MAFSPSTEALIAKGLAAYDEQVASCPFKSDQPPPSPTPCPACAASAREGCPRRAGAAFSFIEAVRAVLERPDQPRNNVARAAVEEVFGPEGAGPFSAGSGLTRGGRSPMPVEHSEERAIDRQLEGRAKEANDG